MASRGEHQARLTKPAGSLGELEELSVRLAGLAGGLPAAAAGAGRSSRSSPATTACTPRASRPGRRRSPRRWSPTSSPAAPRSTRFARQAGVSGDRRRRRRRRRPGPGRRADLAKVRARHPGHDRRARDDPRRGASPRSRSASPSPTQLIDGGAAGPAHRRHGHRQHHRVGRAHLASSPAATRDGHRLRHRHRRAHPPAQDRGHQAGAGAARPVLATTRPRPGRRCSPRSAAWSTPALAGFILGARRRAGCRSSSTA